MELAPGFSFQPIPPIEDPETFAAPAAGEAAAVFEPAADPLGQLAGLAGRWTPTACLTAYAGHSVARQDALWHERVRPANTCGAP